jgi:Secretion system C-terminal sorting domain/SprB repeat
MKKKFFLTLVIGILFYPVMILSQDLISVKGFGGSGDNRVFKAAIDNQNNVYLVGYFNGTVNAGANFTAYGSGYDAYVSKYDANGNLLWFKQIGSTGYDDFVDAVALSDDGTSIYVSGGFSGPVCNFGDGYSLTNTSIGFFDSFLVNLKTSDGTVNSVKSVVYGKGDERTQSMRFDKNSNLVIIGYFQGNSQAAYFSPTDSIVCSGPQNYFILQLNPALNVNWVKTFTGNNVTNKLFALDVDNDGYYIAGTNKNTLNLDIATLNSQAGSSDIFMFKTDFNGNGQWVRRIKGSGNDVSVYSTCDQLGYIYVSGYFASTDLRVDSTATTVSARTVTNKGSNDVFYAKYKTDGTLQWFDTEGSKGDDRLTRLFTNGKYIVIAGQFGDSMTIGNQTIVPKGGIDAYGVVHDANDNFLYAIASGGSGTDVNQFGLIDNKGMYIFIGQSYSPIDYFSPKDSLINPTPSTRDVYIAKYDKASIKFSVDTITCSGAANASINAQPQGAFYGNTSFIWTMKGNAGFSKTSQRISGLAPGTYYCKVTDDLAYSKTDSVLIQDPLPVGIAFNTVSNASCFNSLTGKILITATGGKAPYTYNWSTSNGAGIVQSQKNQTALGAGKYNIKVSDYHSCSALGDTVISEPAALTITGIITNVSDSGANNGAITTTVTGGTGSYTYLWTPGNFTTKDISAISGGIYTDSVEDANLCLAVKNFTVLEPGMLIIDSIKVQNVTCYGNSDGAISIHVNGSHIPYSFKWTKTEDHLFTSTSQNLSNIASGHYNVTVKDSHIPIDSFVLNSIEVTQNAVLSLDGLPVNLNCKGICSGSINLNTSGGIRPYSFLWNKTGDPDFTASTENITGLCAGTYNATVTDKNGCITTGSWVITEPLTALTISSLSVVNITCYGGNHNGSINACATGGTPPYTFTWPTFSDPGVTCSGITKLTANNYRLTLSDAKGCTVILDTAVKQPTQFAYSTTLKNPRCFGNSNGAINVCVTGSNPPYSFTWSNGHITTDSLCSFVDALAPGTYTVNITDSKNCSPTPLTNLTLNEPAAISISGIVKNVSVHGKKDGAIITTVTGGIQPYKYNWRPGNDTTKDLTGIGGGIYIDSVTDANSCNATNIFPVKEPGRLSVGFTVDSVSCNGGSNGKITLDVTGDHPPFIYSWTKLEDTTFSDTTKDLVGISAGHYSVEIKDSPIDTLVSHVFISNLPVFEPPALSMSAAVTNVACNGACNGNINISPAGGTLPYSFQWTKTGDPSFIPTTKNISGICPGTYSLVVTDAKGCSTSGSWTITEPSAMTICSTGKSNVTCFGGTNGAINASACGGTKPYTFVWSTGKIETAVTNSGIMSVDSGIYTLTLQDANGCTIVLTDTIAQPAAFAFTPTLAQPKCFGNSNGSINLCVTGNNAPYSFSWSNGHTTTDSLCSFNGGLSAGVNSVIITDSKNCMDTIHNMILSQPDGISIVTSSIRDSICFGAGNGFIDPSVSGGTISTDYNYNWSPGGDITKNITNLSHGSYTLLVTDANGCTNNYSWTIFEPSQTLAIINTTVKNQSCNNGTHDGSICLSLSGGFTPYHLLWSTGDTTSCITQLAADSYSVTVNDIIGCSVQGSYLVHQPAPFAVSSNLTNPSCFGDSNGSIKICVTGSNPPYSFNWSDGQITSDSLCSFNGSLISGNYSVNITDSLNCSDSISNIILYSPALISIGLNSIKDTICFGAANGFIDPAVSGGTTPYKFNWSPGGDTSQNISGLSQGADSILVTDANSCIGKQAWFIHEALPIVLDTAYALHDTVYILASGGFGNFIYTLDTLSNSTGKFPVVSSGTHYIRVTDYLSSCYHDTSLNTGISQIRPNEEMLLYPNPFKNEFILEIGSAKTGRYTVEIVNIVGQKVYLRNIETTAGNPVKETFNMSGFPAGIYLFTLKDGSGSVTQRVLKQ